MSESTAVLVQTETVGATVIVTGATVIGTVPIGPQGPAGVAGPEGDPGEGVPTGGTDGQVLTKTSATDFATAWENPAAGGAVEEVVAGAGISVDATDPAAPIVTAEVTQAELGTLALQDDIAVPADITATGTPSGTTFLRGDGAWATPAGGGSGVVEAVVAGTNIDVDATDPANPIVSLETLVDADIPATIARDSEVAAGYQPLDADLTALAAANNSAVLAATTASFLTADETKLDGIEALADVTDAANVTAAGAVMTSGAQTVAGVKTFSSDPLIPDEAYDATAWNGSLEPPTKNATRDKIEAVILGYQADDLSYFDYYTANLAPIAEPVAQAHIDDATAAHAATAVANTPAGGIVATTVQAAINELDTEKAPLASPAFTGNPTAPTAGASDNDTTIATTEHVHLVVADYVPRSAGIVTVSAGSNLSTARPTADVVYWLFNAGTVVGDEGENIVNGQAADLWFVAP